jgi:hypothetical protein
MKKIISALFAMSIFTTAQASFLVEPFLGTNMNSEITNNSSGCGNDCTGDVTGSSLGARVGWQNMGLQLGGAFKLSQLDVDGEDSSVTSMGVFVGYELPILFRFWAEYTLSSTVELNDANAKLTEGTGTTIGVGYTGLPFIAINLEMSTINYEELESGSTTTSADQDLKTMLLSVSLPLTF